MRMPARITASLVVILPLVFISATPAQTGPAAACAGLADAQLPNTTITAAQAIVSGSFTTPGSTNAFTYRNLPPFCRVAGVIAPTREAHIRFEVWLPLQNWNGRFTGVGNYGGVSGISFDDLANQIRRGSASASTDKGLVAAPGFDATLRFLYEHPEKLIDFAYRAHHETTVNAKALAHAFYGKPPEHSYWIGCSAGGWEGLMEAQRFPADYDGIVAGAPVNNASRHQAGALDGILAVFKDSASNLPPSALGVLYRAVLAACDSTDGVVDGVLEDPRRCRFDPAAVQCAANQRPETCLTPAQVEAARRVYRGLADPITGAQLYPGLAAGSEPFWPYRNPANQSAPYFKWLVFADPNWDWRTFAFTDPADYQAFLKAESTFALLNATDPNLGEFQQRGGKLVQYHGWSDGSIAPQNSIDYYDSVISFLGDGRQDRTAAVRNVESFYRLFMAPGMAHCCCGPGPNVFDMQTALEQWVERGIAPEQIVATHSMGAGVVDRLRPLCPYPKVAAYKGKGDTNDASNFVCRDPNATAGAKQQ